jgi:fibronectin type 3 domain-containing protein
VLLSLGYYDTVHANSVKPSPWQGSSNVSFWGGTSDGFYDAGAILLQNIGATATVLSPGVFVDGFANAAKFHLWDSFIGTGFTIQAGQSVLLTQTTGRNFDTSDQPFIGSAAISNAAQPVIHLTLDGQPLTFVDADQVLNTGGFDPAAALGFNKSRPWKQIGATLAQPVNELSYHGDAGSTGQNLNELMLTTASVNATSFGKFFSVPVDGQVYAQPLYMSGVNITAGSAPGIHNVAFVATQHDSVYAIDAAQGIVLWQDSFINPAAGITTVPNWPDTNTFDISPEIGITSTPVIDPATGTLYLTAKTKEVYGGNNHYVYRLHALNIANGTERTGSPVVIGDTITNDLVNYTYVSGPSVNGTGDGSINGTLTFNALRQMNRPGLTLANGSVYIAFASHGDNGPYHGWVLGYNTQTLKLNAVFNTTPNGGLGGIWQAGGAVIADSQGFLYFETGNGTFDTQLNTSGFPQFGDYGDSFVKLAVDPNSSPTSQNVNGWGLKVVDYFTPFNQDGLNAGDVDLGSGGPILLPLSAGSAAHPHLLVGQGKEGRIYLVDRDNMGKFDPNTDHVVQELPGATYGVWSSPAYFNSTVYYVAAWGDVGRSFTIANAALTPGPTTTDNYAYPGSTPTVSADGTANGIVWDLDRGSNQLRAYSAGNYGQELYNSSQAANNRDQLGSVVKFTVPQVANGEVFVGTANSLAIYGLFTPPTTVPAAPLNVAAAALSPTQVSVTWQDVSNNESGFKVQRSTDGVHFMTIVTVSVNSTSYEDSGLSPGTVYYYQVLSTNVIGDSTATNTASVTTLLPVGGAWQDQDIGGPTPAGSFSQSGGTITVNGAGGDIWNTGDSFHYVYLPVTSDTSIVARVVSEQYTDPWAKAGVMIRETLNADSSYAFMFVTPGNGIDFQYRNGTGIFSGWNGQIGGNAPYWVELVRSGNTFTGYASPDGVSYTQVGSITIPMAASAYVGLALTSHNDGTLNTSTFDNVSISVPDTNPPAAPTGLTATAVTGTEVTLSWADNSSNETGFKIERSPDGTNFSQVATVGTDTTSYLDTALNFGTNYFYRVRATNSFGDSAYTNTASVTTPVPPAAPSNAVATLVTTNEIDFSWQDNSNTEDGYEIFLKSGTGGTSNLYARLPAVTPPAPSVVTYQIKGLKPGVFYGVNIQAFNNAGFSAVAGFTTMTVALAPTNLTAAPSLTQVSLSWTGSTGAASYNIYRGTSSGGGGQTPIATGVTGSSFIDTNVSFGTAYFYQVTAVDTGGESARATETATATPFPDLAGQTFNLPGSPYTLTLSPYQTVHATSWTVNWGDGSSQTVPGDTTTLVHTYLAVCRDYVISATITDAAGTRNANLTIPVSATFASENQCFIAQVYQDLLGRNVDPSGLASWAGYLDANASANRDPAGVRALVVQSIEASPEYLTRAIENFYTVYLGRGADPFGLNSFLTFLNQGGALQQVQAAILGSGEYFARAGGTAAGFLNAVYRDVLSRSVDLQGSALWNAALAGGASRQQVATTILNSSEAQGDAIQSFFAQYLHRSADAFGLTSFLAAMQQGVPEEVVLASIVGSGEYYKRV